MLNQIILGDCYELMKEIPDGTIDAIISDFPYNTTGAETDKNPFNPAKFWPQAKRILKLTGIVVTTASQPFTTDLINSNREWFRYCWVWDKINRYTGTGNVKRMPLKRHEDIVVFYRKQPTYNPQYVIKPRVKYGSKKGYGAYINGNNITEKRVKRNEGDEHNPCTVIEIPACIGEIDGSHPTQKPIALFEYLIKTYSNSGEIILDPYVGSGTAALAAFASGRNFIAFEEIPKYCEIANKRLALAQSQLRFDEMVG